MNLPNKLTMMRVIMVPFFMVFAAMSTVLGVCENILAMIRELTGWARPSSMQRMP